jgi:hypothetical protein
MQVKSKEKMKKILTYSADKKNEYTQLESCSQPVLPPTRCNLDIVDSGRIRFGSAFRLAATNQIKKKL